MMLVRYTYRRILQSMIKSTSETTECACARRPLSREEQDFAAQPTQFHGILRRILPVALRLACGPEPVARQLFEPLVMSLVHWFTRAARR